MSIVQVLASLPAGKATILVCDADGVFYRVGRDHFRAAPGQAPVPVPAAGVPAYPAIPGGYTPPDLSPDYEGAKAAQATREGWVGGFAWRAGFLGSNMDQVPWAQHVETGELRVLDPLVSHGCDGCTAGRLSPDGRWGAGLAFRKGVPTPQLQTQVLVDLEAGDVRPLADVVGGVAFGPVLAHFAHGSDAFAALRVALTPAGSVHELVWVTGWEA